MTPYTYEPDTRAERFLDWTMGTAELGAHGAAAIYERVCETWIGQAAGLVALLLVVAIMLPVGMLVRAWRGITR